MFYALTNTLNDSLTRSCIFFKFHCQVGKFGFILKDYTYTRLTLTEKILRCLWTAEYFCVKNYC
jgi:hypothetical protein